jgi:microcystin-dependent protein
MPTQYLYTLTFSDPTKTDTIIVPGTTTSPGRNNYDTSLDLVGPGYVAYGQSIAQNFVKLLENFSSPHAPSNAIEGQLWYDTSNPNRKVLRVHNGTLTSSRWPSASGIYQQTNDPAVEYTVSIKEGDLWVDTGNNQLKIRYGSDWTVVGPGFSAGETRSGAEVTTIESNTGTDFPVILNWVNGKVVEIISQTAFVPRTVIEGFSGIKAGTNLTTRNNAKYNGTAEKALALLMPNGTLINATDVLKNRATSQTHTGTFRIETGDLYVQNALYNQNLRIYNASGAAYVNFSNTASTNFRVGIEDKSYIKFNAFHGNVGINTSTTAQSPTLTVYGGGSFKDSLTVRSETNTISTSAGALTVVGGVGIGGNLVVGQGITVTGITTATGKLVLGSVSGSGTILEPASNNVYDLGTTSTAFRKLFVSQIGATGTNVDIYGTVIGSVTQLATARNFSIRGQIEASTSTFNGTANVIFTATIARNAIASPTGGITTSTTATQTILVLDTATTATSIQSISKKHFLSDIYGSIFQPGMIVAYSSSTAKAGFLTCDGSSYSQLTYVDLYADIGTTYGTAGPGTFRVPDLSRSTILTKSTESAVETSALTSAGATTISVTTTTNISGSRIVEGSGAIPYGTIVQSTGPFVITLNSATVADIPAGTVLSFSTATYVKYMIKT